MTIRIVIEGKVYFADSFIHWCHLWLAVKAVTEEILLNCMGKNSILLIAFSYQMH